MTRLVLALCLVVASSPAHALPRGAQSLRPAATPNATALKTVCGQDAQGNYIPGKLVPGTGPLIQHVKVFDVFYNTGNQYKDMLAAYYTAITQSAYFDWLSEYNTASYKISRGSFLGSFEDSNSATTAKTLSETQVQTYLAGLIDAKKVPAPDDDTIYMIYFPTPISLTLQGSTSCASGGFCAYHSSFTHGSANVRYGVMPDQAAGGCSMGCGPGNAFQNTTDVSSHELIEAVTDPDGGTGWYDASCGEIGDICAIGMGEGAVVNNFTVQREWSNKNNDCIAVDPNVVVNDFSVAASPAMVSVPVGGMATTTITLTKKAGNAENAMLTATAPTGLTASFSPTSVTSAAGTSTLTIAAAASATVGSTLKVSVKAAGMSVQPTVDVSVVIIDAPDMAQPATGGSGGTGGGGSGGSGGGSGDHGGSSGCSVGGGDLTGSWAMAGLVLFGLALRRRRV